MDQHARRALMKKVSYGYFKLPLKEEGHGVLTIAAAQNGEGTHYGASICAPTDMFSRMRGKFGAREYNASAEKWDRTPGAHDRLSDHLRGIKGLLQGRCPSSGGSSFEDIQVVADAVLYALRTHAGSRKLKWLRDVDFDAVGPMTKQRKTEGSR